VGSVWSFGVFLEVCCLEFLVYWRWVIVGLRVGGDDLAGCLGFFLFSQLALCRGGGG